MSTVNTWSRPQYDVSKSYQWNYDHPPAVPTGIEVPDVAGNWTFCGCTAKVCWPSKSRMVMKGDQVLRSVETSMSCCCCGSAVKVLDQRDDWSRVRLEDGRHGWMASRFLEPIE